MKTLLSHLMILKLVDGVRSALLHAQAVLDAKAFSKNPPPIWALLNFAGEMGRGQTGCTLWPVNPYIPKENLLYVKTSSAPTTKTRKPNEGKPPRMQPIASPVDFRNDLVQPSITSELRKVLKDKTTYREIGKFLNLLLGESSWDEKKVGKYLRGERRFHRDVFFSLCERYGEDPTDLSSRAIDRQKGTFKTSELMKRLKELQQIGKEI